MTDRNGTQLEIGDVVKIVGWLEIRADDVVRYKPLGLQSGMGKILKNETRWNNIKVVSISVPSSGGPFVIVRKLQDVQKVSDEVAMLWMLENA
jgi:hypothetical protein